MKDFPLLNRIPGESAFETEEKDVRHTRPTLSRQEAERLVETYSDLVLRLSYTYLKSREDAKDICQTVFLKLLEKPRAFDSPEHEKAWIRDIRFRGDRLVLLVLLLSRAVRRQRRFHPGGVL